MRRAVGRFLRALGGKEVGPAVHGAVRFEPHLFVRVRVGPVAVLPLGGHRLLRSPSREQHAHAPVRHHRQHHEH